MSNPFKAGGSAERNSRGWGNFLGRGNKPAEVGEDAEIAKREAAISAREAELDRREAGMRARAQGEGNVEFRDIRNYPPCFPLVHHDINNDIPLDFRGQVRRVYYSYLGLCLCLLLNILVITISLFAKISSKNKDDDDKGANAVAPFLAVIYFACGVPLAWLLWYMRLYNGVKSDSAIGHGIFFLFYLLHIVFCVFMALGLELGLVKRGASAGVIIAVDIVKQSAWAGILYFIVAGLWIAETVFSILNIIMVYRVFRGRGGNQRLQKDVMQGAAKAAAQVQMESLAGGRR